VNAEDTIKVIGNLLETRSEVLGALQIGLPVPEGRADTTNPFLDERQDDRTSPCCIHIYCGEVSALRRKNFGSDHSHLGSV
jgi:hypothetical protein